MENEEKTRTLDATAAAEIRFLVDAETLGWLQRESARTGISLEKVASAMLRKACSETPALGAPGTTVSAGRAMVFAQQRKEVLARTEGEGSESVAQ